jgi:hypothetical protein
VRPEEAVASDALQELGLERLTLWHLRCVEAFLRAMPDHHVGPGERLLNDLRSGPDRIWADAKHEDSMRRVVVMLGGQRISGFREIHYDAGWDDRDRGRERGHSARCAYPRNACICGVR